MGRDMPNFNFRQTVELPSTTYLTHGIHAYPAKFIPHIPHWFLRRYSQPGQLMLDPFAGSGTALVEANLYGQDALGVDINPLTPMLIRVKTHLPADMKAFAKEVTQAARAAAHSTDHFEPPVRKLAHWFLPQARAELGRIFGYLNANPDSLPADQLEFLKICASAAVRKVSNADPKVSKPFVSRRRRADLAVGRVPQNAQHAFEKRVESYLRRKKAYTKEMRALAQQHNWSRMPTAAPVPGSDARTLAGVADESIDIVVTSPPYANAQEYFRSVKLELFWLGLVDPRGLRDLHGQIVGTERIGIREFTERSTFPGLPRLDALLAQVFARDDKRAEVLHRYFSDMRLALQQVYRVLKPGGYFGMLVGDNRVRKIPVATHEFLIALAEQAGFTTHQVGYDPIKIRALTPDRAESAGVIDVEWMMVFHKPAGG